MLATSNTRKSGSSGILFLGLGVIVGAAVGFLLLQDPTPDPVPPGNGGTEHSAGPEDPERPEAAAAAAQLEVRPGDRETLRNPGRTFGPSGAARARRCRVSASRRIEASGVFSSWETVATKSDFIASMRRPRA